MTYYVVYVFDMAGLTGNTGLIASGVQYAIFIIFTTAVFFFIDKTGRRPLLIYGALGMAICMFVVGGVLGTHGKTVPAGSIAGNDNIVISISGAGSHVVIAFSYMLVAIYATTLAPVAWVYAAEVWSLETRATGMSLAAVANWLFNFAIGLFVPPAFLNITYKIFIIFGVLCVAAAVQAYFTYPETCGKTYVQNSYHSSRAWIILLELKAMWQRLKYLSSFFFRNNCGNLLTFAHADWKKSRCSSARKGHILGIQRLAGRDSMQRSRLSLTGSMVITMMMIRMRQPQRFAKMSEV